MSLVRDRSNDFLYPKAFSTPDFSGQENLRNAEDLGCYKIPSLKQLEEQKACFRSQLEVQSIVVVRSSWQECEAVGHIVSAVRKQ